MSIQESVFPNSAPPNVATLPPAPPVAAIRALLTSTRQGELLARLPPEQRALYERIRSHRDAMNIVSFDVGEAIREMRANG